MKSFRIAVIPGDGVGPEVTHAAVGALELAANLAGNVSFSFEYFPWGCKYYTETGQMMPPNGIERLKPFDAILLGAVGFPGVPDHVSLWGLLLKIRKEFDQYVNLRPVKLLKNAPTVLKNPSPGDINMIFVRENTEGEYAGLGGFSESNGVITAAEQISRFTRAGTERVMRYAFELARREGLPLTSVSKSNALNYSMVFWDSLFNEMSQEYPDVPTNTLLVDAAAMHMINTPQRFGVVVASNLFGDILTDLGAAIAGGIGLAAGANLNPERRFPSMFEPIHGSAPDIAGTGKANPLAALWACSQMLDFLGLENIGKHLLSAIESVLAAGKDVLTPDMGGTGSTQTVSDAFAAALAQELA